MPETTDPLHLLPPEVVLRVLDFTLTAGLASLTRLNQAWHSFIDEDHQDVIYGPKTSCPPGAKNFEFLNDTQSFCNYFADVSSWKDLCKRQTLLPRNWNAQSPVTRESTIQIGDHPVWRFKPDFKRRLILSTSQAGGLNITDMDTGGPLYHLARDVVRPFAHLEYQDGTAVFDCEGNAVEVWRLDERNVAGRGVFTRVAVLQHDKTTRGFQLSFDTLCVVSSEGQGFVYENMIKGEPRLKTQMPIEEGATGHLHQTVDAVAWSQGTKGYHFYDKTSGQCLGVLQPAFCSASDLDDRFFHMTHNEGGLSPGLHRLGEGRRAGFRNMLPPQHPRRDRTLKVSVLAGPMPLIDGEFIPHSEDEWGAGMFDGDLFAGVSRGGRVFVCSNWRKALQDSAAFATHTTIVECDSDGSTFDLGGWLSVRDHRIMFEIQDRVYVLGLDDHNRVIATAAAPTRQSFTFASCLSEQLAVPISFMSLYDDCIMTTYTTLRPRDRSIFELAARDRSVNPTKLIRILSFAPSLDGNDNDIVEQGSVGAYDGLREDMFELVHTLVDEAEDDGEGVVESTLDLANNLLAHEDLEELD